MKANLLLSVILLLAKTSLAPGQQAEVLGTFPADTEARLQYRLVIGPCDSVACPLRAVLADGDRELGSDTLDWPARPGVEVGEEEECWSTSTEEWFLDTCPSIVKLDSGLLGLMVEQRGGGAHVHSRYHLYVEVDGALRTVWEEDTGLGGPRWMSVEVVDVDGDGIDEINHLTVGEGGYYGSTDDYTDTWWLVTLGWNAEERGLRRVARPERKQPIYAAIVGSFETIPEARAAFEELKYATQPDGKRKYCLGGFQVLESGDYPMLTPGWFIIASFSADEAEAASDLQNAESCNTNIDGYVKRAG